MVRKTKSRSRFLLLGVLGGALIAHASPRQTSAPTQSSTTASHPQEIPVMNGEAGSCSLDLAVTSDGKPVYAAKIKVHIAYGFGGVRRLDLEAFTNADGKVRFTGLPSRVRRPPLYFEASKGDLMGTAAFDPAVECEAKHDVVLQAPKTPEAK